MSHSLRFVIIPKVVHPWFDEVHEGALDQARLIEAQTGAAITIEYCPPRIASIAEQQAIIARVTGSKPNGIALDPVEAIEKMAAVDELRQLAIPLILFDSPTARSGIPSVGNDFALQGMIAAERLVHKIGAQGKVAIMRGVPSAPNHQARYEAQLAVLRKHPDITVVDGGTDNDEIARAEAQAAAVIARIPDLKGYLCCDASGPIGIAAAVKAAGEACQVTVVGMDGIRPILDAIKAGIIDSSASTKPRMQGAMAVLMLWQASLGMKMPQLIDTGIDLITPENIATYVAG